MNLDETNSSSFANNEYSMASNKDYENFCDESAKNAKNSIKERYKIYYFFLCSNCRHSLPIIIFIGELLEIRCICGIKGTFTYEKAFKTFMLSDENIDKVAVACLYCNKDGCSKKIEFYCRKCEKNLCSTCSSECCGHKKEVKFLPMLYEKKETKEMIATIKAKLEEYDNIINNHLKIIIKTTLINLNSKDKKYRYHYSYYSNIKSIYDYLLSIRP